MADKVLEFGLILAPPPHDTRCAGIARQVSMPRFVKGWLGQPFTKRGGI